MKAIVGLIGMLGCMLVAPAHSAMLTVSGTGSVHGGSYSFGPVSDSGYISGGQSVASVDGYSYAESSAWGNSYGTYRASASGIGHFDSQGIFHRSLTITNTNTVATQFSLNAFIYAGALIVDNHIGATGNGWASFDLDISKEGQSLFDSYAKVYSDGTLDQVGSLLNGATMGVNLGAISYRWDNTAVTLDLGVMAAGGSMTIDFDLVSTAYGNFDFSSQTRSYEVCEYGGYDKEDFCTTYTYTEDGSAEIYASLGDPDTPSATLLGGVFSATAVNQVPSPGTFSLLSLGLLGLGAFRRQGLQS